MSGFQSIVDIQQSMTVSNRRMIGQQSTRSGQLFIAQYLTTVPWVFTITPHQYLYYPQVRDIIQTIDNLDRQNVDTITFASDNLKWFTAYQGDLTPTQYNALTIASAPATNSQVITVGNLPSVSSTAFVFKQGDFIQIGNYVYKVATTVTRGSGSTITVQLNRPIIGTVGIGTLTAVGNNVVFTVVAQECPTYTLNPMTDGAFVKWDGNFVFREYIVG